MRVQVIGNQSYAYNLHKKTKKNPEIQFKAKELRIFNEVQNSITKSESLPRFKQVMNEFEQKLINDTDCPEDIVGLHMPTWDQKIDTKEGKKSANILMIAGNQGANFYYNAKNTVSQIAEDLYKTYRYILDLRNNPPVVNDYDPIGDFNSYYYSHLP